ncbi:unnamed protein product [Schistosoma curassoni]|nr:unnamed protein product [Schistosoma curassoni]
MLLKTIILIYGLIIILIYREGNTLNYLSQECDSKSEWGPWRCPGIGTKCTANIATRYKCIGGNCTSDSLCAKLENHTQSDSCVKVLQRGECEPWWTNWSSWSKCTTTCRFHEKHLTNLRIHEGVEKVSCPVSRLCSAINGGWSQWSEFTECSVTCGIGKRVRRRHCDHPRPQEGGLYCIGTDHQELFASKLNCLRRKSVFCEGYLPCPRKGQWCSWSPIIQHCTRNCGPRGMGLRLRQCACPKPSQDGEDCEIPPETAEMAVNLLVNNTTDAPTGSALEAILKGEGLWEPCNRHHCSYLKTLNTEEDLLLLEDLNLQRAEDAWISSGGLPQRIHGPLKLFCPSSRNSRKKIFDKSERFPKSKFYWTRSIPTSSKEPYYIPGIPIVNSNLFIVENDHLTIHSLDPSTMGIYRFGYEYEPGYFETVCFFPVYIHQWQQVLSHGETFDLVCNSLGLWPIISKSTTTKWFIYWNVTLLEKEEQNDIKKHKLWWYTELKNSHIDKHEGNNSFDNQTDNPSMFGTQFTLWDTEYKRLYDTVKKMTGYYECHIFNQLNSTYNRTFITQSIHLIIKPPPNIWTLVKGWCLQHQINLIILFLISIMTSLSYATYKWTIAKRLSKLEIQMNETRKHRQSTNFDDIYIIN